MESDVLQSSAFVGRQQEMGELRVLLESALVGRGRLVMLAGEPGIGKTRTAQELAAVAERLGALALWGRCYEGQGAPPYWPWVQLIRSYIRECDAKQLRDEMGAGASDIAEIVPDVKQRLPDLEPSPRLENAEQARFRLFDSITTFLKNAAQNHALMLILDNLHGADKPSLLLLEFLAQELRDIPLFILGTYRDMELSRQHPLSETLAELTRESAFGGFQRLTLRGLSFEDVSRFIEATSGINPPAGLVQAIYTQTEGNPLFVTEVVRMLQQEGELDAQAAPEEQGEPRRVISVSIPEGVREVIGRRLNQLSESCTQTLSIASVIGREFGLNELQELIDHMSEARLLEAVEEAMATSVIEELPQTVARYQFTHVMIRETLYDELTGTRRARLHRRIGEVMEELYSANLEPYLAQIATHFFEAAQSGSAAKAIDYAMRTAERGMLQLAYEEAVRSYQMALQVIALRESVDERQRLEIFLALGGAQRKAGDFAAAMETFVQAAEVAKRHGSAEDLANAAIGFEEATWRPGLLRASSVKLLEEALEALGEEDSSNRARVLASLSRALSFVNSLERAQAVGQEALQCARTVGDITTLIDALRSVGFFTTHAGVIINVDEHVAMHTELMKLAQETDDKEALLEARTWRLFYLLEFGEDIKEIDAHIEVYNKTAKEIRQPHYIYLGESWLAMRALMNGRFADAEELAKNAMNIGQRLRSEGVNGAFAMQMFTVRKEQGRLGELEAGVQMFVQQNTSASMWRPGLALIYSELHQEDKARAEFEQLAADDFTNIPRDGIWSNCMVYLAEVCAYLKDVPRASTLYELLLPYEQRIVSSGAAAVCFGPTSHYLGLLASTMSRWIDAERHFQNALELSSRFFARPWTARTQHAYAEMLLFRNKSDDRQKAKFLLDQAMAAANDLGMRSLEERVNSLLENIGAARPQSNSYPDSLTQREVEVLRLIASGMSNREIAGELFITANTVANHVKNILSKTASTNRTEAAAYAIGHGLI